MSDRSKHILGLPPEQEAIRAKCFHPSGTFVEFPKEEVEQSVPARFEKIVSKYPDRIAIKSGNQLLTYTELNAQANRIAHAIVGQRGDQAEPVAILLENGAPLMVATLGILKARKLFTLAPLAETSQLIWLSMNQPKSIRKFLLILGKTLQP